jgi:hypothetical protein
MVPGKHIVSIDIDVLGYNWMKQLEIDMKEEDTEETTAAPPAAVASTS